MPKRIVFHTASLRGGGAERVFVLVANEMAARGHDVTLFTWNAEGPNAALVSPAVRLVSLDMPLRGEGFAKTAPIAGVIRSRRFLRQAQPDVVFSAPEFANLLMALTLMAGLWRVRFFPSFHAARAMRQSGLGARLAIGLSRLVAMRATRAIAVSSGIADDLVARGFARDRISVIHNPLPPLAKLAPVLQPWQEALAGMGEGPVIVTAGRLVAVKDQRTLLDAFARLRARRPARLVIFGEGPLEANLRAFADQMGISADVLFAGYINDPRTGYAAANLFVLSSTSEGFGNVLVEAMAAGVPVVSTDAPHGPREILAGGRYGALVPVGDAAALAEAMAAMLDQPTPADSLRQRAADFSIDRIGDAYEALID
jgi:glycosyltransferase involved in cell wall biosynthesis